MMATTLKKQLLKMRADSPNARKLFDALLDGYPNQTRKSITIEILARRTGLRQKALRDVLGVLEELHVGRIVFGRRGKKTRFDFDSEFDFQQDIPPRQPNEPNEIDPTDALALRTVANAKSVTLTEWTLSLAGKRHIRLALPAVVTKADVARLRQFCDKYEAMLPG